MPGPAQPSALITLFENTGAQEGAVTTGLRDRLCAALRKAINTGALTAGQRLPSSRMLAADLKVSRITVEAAYAQTEAEGYLRRHTGKGTFVSTSLSLPSAPRKGTTTPPASQDCPYADKKLSRLADVVIHSFPWLSQRDRRICVPSR